MTLIKRPLDHYMIPDGHTAVPGYKESYYCIHLTIHSSFTIHYDNIWHMYSNKSTNE